MQVSQKSFYALRGVMSWFKVVQPVKNLALEIEKENLGQGFIKQVSEDIKNKFSKEQR